MRLNKSKLIIYKLFVYNLTHTIVIRYRTIFNINKLVIAIKIIKQAKRETFLYVAKFCPSLTVPTMYVKIVP